MTFVCNVSGLKNPCTKMENHYQERKYQEVLSLGNGKYDKQDFKALYSMLNSFEGMILEAAKNIERKKLQQEYRR